MSSFLKYLKIIFSCETQASVLRIWGGNNERKVEAQEMGLALAKANSEATLGKYSGPHPSTCTDDLREGFRGWGNTQDSKTN